MSDIPNGWKLVPIAPTEAMIEAAFVLRTEAEGIQKPLKSSAIWLAMLDAAPEPPSAGGDSLIRRVQAALAVGGLCLAADQLAVLCGRVRCEACNGLGEGPPLSEDSLDAPECSTCNGAGWLEPPRARTGQRDHSDMCNTVIGESPCNCPAGRTPPREGGS